MIVEYFGHSCFRLRGKQDTIVIDPFKDIGLSLPEFDNIDIVAISHSHFDHSNKDAVKGNYKLVEGAGEYDIKNIFIQGITLPHDKKGGEERGLTTAYKMLIDNIRFCHLGDLGDVLTSQQVEAIGPVDILCVPVGGNYTLDAEGAIEVINQIQPTIAIPMHYKTSKSNLEIASLEPFLTQWGSEENVRQVKQLNVSESNFQEEEATTSLVIFTQPK